MSTRMSVPRGACLPSVERRAYAQCPQGGKSSLGEGKRYLQGGKDYHGGGPRDGRSRMVAAGSCRRAAVLGGKRAGLVGERGGLAVTRSGARRLGVGVTTGAMETIIPPEDKKSARESQLNITVNTLLLTSAVSAVIYRYTSTQGLFWRGWSLSEILHAVPREIWSVYLHYSITQPLLVPAVITGVTYTIADWISQTYEGRFALDFDRDRIFRSAAIGFFLLGPFAHSYYVFQDATFSHFFPSNPTFLIPLKIALDQSLYAAAYNVLFYSSQGLASGKAVPEVVGEIRKQFWRLMKAGWKLWPFVHCITYTVIPTEHKVLWVDSVEIIWATILCVIVNEKRQENVDAVAALDGTSAKEGVMSSLSSYISEVREEQWSEELLPEEEKSEHSSLSWSNAAPNLLEAIDAEDLTRNEINELVKMETDQLESGFYAEIDMADAICPSDMSLDTRVQLANKLEAVLAEVENTHSRELSFLSEPAPPEDLSAVDS